MNDLDREIVVWARDTLERVKALLARNEQQRDWLQALGRDCEGLLAAPVGTIGEAYEQLGDARTVRVISTNEAVMTVLRDAGGQALHVREIAARAVALGARTIIADRSQWINGTMAGLVRSKQPIERTAPGTWRWRQEQEGK